jgi:hypothetical protein
LPITAVKIAIGVVPTVLVLGRGLWVLASKIDNPVRGVPVRGPEQPELSALVRRVAEVVLCLLLRHCGCSRRARPRT